MSARDSETALVPRVRVPSSSPGPCCRSDRNRRLPIGVSSDLEASKWDARAYCRTTTWLRERSAGAPVRIGRTLPNGVSRPYERGDLPLTDPAGDVGLRYCCRWTDSTSLASLLPLRKDKGR